MRLQILAAALLLPLAALAQPQDPGAPSEEPVPEIVVVTEASAPPSASSEMLPSRGMNKAMVTEQYGAPREKRAPVGGASRRQPPITRWDYDGYSVIFEYDQVIDTVVLGQPAPIAVYDGLEGGPQ